MKKRIFFLMLCFFANRYIFCQVSPDDLLKLYPEASNSSPVFQETIELPFKIIESKGQLSIELGALPDSSELPTITALYLKKTDLVLEFDYLGAPHNYANSVIAIKGIKSKHGNGQVYLPNDIVNTTLMVIKGNHRNRKVGLFTGIMISTLKLKEKHQGQRIWLDAGENVLEYGEDYLLIVERNLYQDVNCERGRPRIRPIHIIPAASAIFIGTGSVITSYILKAKQDKAYEKYIKTWEAGGSEEDGEGFFNSAKKKQKNARLLKGIGSSLLSLGFIYEYAVTMRVIVKRARYIKYCKESYTPYFTLSPKLDVGNGVLSAVGVAPGLNIGLRF